MAKAGKPIPEGFHAVTPSMVVKDARRALDFYQRAFGAIVLGVSHGPGGKVINSTIRIGDSLILVNDEFPHSGSNSPQLTGGASISIHLYVEDADTAFNRAGQAGATVVMPIMDAFWGDRYGQVTDSFGHRWSLGTRKQDLSPEEMEKAQKEAFAKMQCKG